MPEESSAGASYLAALKQMSAPTGATAAPMPASQIGDSSSKSYVSEKRRSPRYRCQGSAHLRDARTNVATWATFTDVSLHGCYVEAMSTFRPGTQLVLTIELNGYRIECGGEVRVVYPGLGMGISFTIIADEHRERLRELLRSLAQPSTILGARPVENATNTKPQNSPAIANPAAALQAISDFFQDRHLLGREEFLRILRKSQL
jgi:hypothetical protein